MSCFSTASLVMSRGRGIEKVIHCMPYINQTLLIIQYFIHYTKGDAVTEELYITLYIITDSTRHNKMRWEWGDARDPSLKSHSEVFACGHRGGVSNLQFPRIFKSSHQQHQHQIHTFWRHHCKSTLPLKILELFWASDPNASTWFRSRGCVTSSHPLIICKTLNLWDNLNVLFD